MSKDHFIVCSGDTILRRGVCGNGKALEKTTLPGEYIILLEGQQVYEDIERMYKLQNRKLVKNNG